MIDHTIFTVRNLSQSKAFYEQALAPLGMTAMPEVPLGPKQARGWFRR
jgi:catechol 2,3-dioxygenase-like lactoylglutathione lyase family enzyme